MRKAIIAERLFANDAPKAIAADLCLSFAYVSHVANRLGLRRRYVTDAEYAQVLRGRRVAA
jgi:hypothetical protein